MSDEDLKKAYRNGWIMVTLVAVFIVSFFAFVLFSAYGAPKSEWDMGGVKFVPASSDYGEGYYVPPVKGDAP